MHDAPLQTEQVIAHYLVIDQLSQLLSTDGLAPWPTIVHSSEWWDATSTWMIMASSAICFL